MHNQLGKSAAILPLLTLNSCNIGIIRSWSGQLGHRLKIGTVPTKSGLLAALQNNDNQFMLPYVKRGKEFV